MAKCVTTLGQVYILSDLWVPSSDVPLGRDILKPNVLLLQSGWPLVRCIPLQKHLVAKCVTTLGQVDLWSDLPTTNEASGGVEIWSDFGSGWPVVRCTLSPGRDLLWPSVLLLWVKLTFCQIFRSGFALVRCTLWWRHLVAKCVTTLGQSDILSDLWVRLTFHKIYLLHRDIMWPSVLLLQSCWPLVRCTSQAEISCGQVWYNYWVRLTFGQMYPPQMRLFVRLTFGQMYCIPQAETSCGQVYYYFGSGWHFVRSSGQVYLRSDVPPAREMLWPSVLLLWVRLTFCQIFRSGWPFIRFTL